MSEEREGVARLDRLLDELHESAPNLPQMQSETAIARQREMAITMMRASGWKRGGSTEREVVESEQQSELSVSPEAVS